MIEPAVNKYDVVLTDVSPDPTYESPSIRIEWEDWYDLVRYVEVLRAKHGPKDPVGLRLLLRDLEETFQLGGRD